MRDVQPVHPCRFALPEDRTELDQLLAQHRQISGMAQLWTTYMTWQSIAIACTLLLYMQRWTFQITAGIIPRAIVRFLTDGAVITFIVVIVCAALAVVSTALLGPHLEQASTFAGAWSHMLQTFVSGDTGVKEAILDVRIAPKRCMN